MKTQDIIDQNTHCNEHHGSSAGFCSKLISAVADLKEKLQAKYELAFPGRSEQIRNAVADAEERAWETAFPHLFLPDFAEARIAEATYSDSERDYQRAA